MLSIEQGLNKKRFFLVLMLASSAVSATEQCNPSFPAFLAIPTVMFLQSKKLPYDSLNRWVEQKSRKSPILISPVTKNSQIVYFLFKKEICTNSPLITSNEKFYNFLKEKKDFFSLIPKREKTEVIEFPFLEEEFFGILKKYTRLIHFLSCTKKMSFLEKRDDGQYVSFLNVRKKAYIFYYNFGPNIPKDILFLLISFSDPFLSSSKKEKYTIWPGIFTKKKIVLDIFKDKVATEKGLDDFLKNYL